MKAVTRILFLDEEGQKFFGEGPCRLLHAVEQTGSLRAAAGAMGMAYTKALKLLRQAEQALGFALTERAAGGRDGGGSRLTPQGKEWLDTYESYRDACVAANRRLYLEFFPPQRYAPPAADRRARRGHKHAAGGAGRRAARRAPCPCDPRRTGPGGPAAGNRHRGRNAGRPL